MMRATQRSLLGARCSRERPLASRSKGSPQRGHAALTTQGGRRGGTCAYAHSAHARSESPASMAEGKAGAGRTSTQVAAKSVCACACLVCKRVLGAGLAH